MSTFDSIEATHISSITSTTCIGYTPITESSLKFLSLITESLSLINSRFISSELILIIIKVK